jgi:hypothetical protein
MDRVLAAFIAGLFLGLMIIKHVKRKVIEVEVDKQNIGSGAETESETRQPRNQSQTLKPKFA